MTSNHSPAPIIIRTGRGLTISGTRITLYQIMDYLKADWPPGLIRDRLNISEEQMEAVLEYMDQHKAEVEAEYRQVLDEAEQTRQYWESRNKEQLAKLDSLPPQPGKEKLREKIKAWKNKQTRTASS